MHNSNVWVLPFGKPAELELKTDWANLSIVGLEDGQVPRLELASDATERMAVHVDRVGETVRVALDPHASFNWLDGGWERRAMVYVPRSVRAHVQTTAGSVSVRDLVGCELGVKANAGKIELSDVFGVIHLSADAGSVKCRHVGGFFDVETQAGSVRMEIVDLQPGEHRIRASMGSVRLELARGLDVCLETQTSLGSIRNSYPSRESARSTLVVSTQMGSVRVEEGETYTPASDHRPESGPAGFQRARVATPSRAATRDDADPELTRILSMVEAGELSARDADELLRAMERA